MTTSNKYRPREAHFTCKWCHKQFVREQYYLAHECKQMKRDKEAKSVKGQAALSYYQHWFRAQRRSIPRPEAFVESSKFRTLMNFVDYVNKVGMQYPEKFIWLMVEKKLDPIFWTSKEAYAMYLDFVDVDQDPMEQVASSVDTLANIAEQHDVDVSEVFNVIAPAEVLSLLETRKVSPWLLILSKKFHQMCASKASTEQQAIFETLIRPTVWTQKLAKHPNLVKSIRTIVKEMNI